MPFDSEVTKLQGEIQELDDEIETIEMAYSHFQYNKEKVIASLKRTRNRLVDLREHKELKLSMHRQKVKESGVKY